MKEEVFYAPLVNESEEQMRDLGIKKEDCRIWTVGTRRIRVCLVPANQETRDFLIAQLQADRTRERRANRCRVPGQRKAWVRCPAEVSCSTCPYGLQDDSKEASVVSLEVLMDSGFDKAGPDCTAEKAEHRDELRELIRRMNEVNPDLVRIVEWQAAGFSAAEIAGKMGVSQPTVYRALQKIHQIAQDYREGH